MMGRPTMDRRTLMLAGVAATLLPSCVTRQRHSEDFVWQRLSTEPFPGKQDDIAFSSPRRGRYGNGKGRLYSTEAGGDSWTQVWQQPGTFVRALGFIDALHGVMGNVGVGSFPGVTDPTALYRTADGGESWQAITAIDGLVPSGICAIEIVRAAYTDRGERAERAIIHAAGRVGGPAHYLPSADDGSNWRSFDLGNQTAAIYDVKFLDTRTGFIAGSSNADLTKARGLILRTDDGGDTWQEVFRSARAFETVWKLHFPTGRTGYGTIQSYDPDPANVERYVAKTHDGGRTWLEMPLVVDAKWRSFGIGFADERLGWVGGNLGGLETRNGGESWTPVEMGRAVNKIRFVGSGRERRAFAIGSELHRPDLGRS